MTDKTISEGFVKKIEHITESLSYVTLIAPEGTIPETPRVPFYLNLNGNYLGKFVRITRDVFPKSETEDEIPYSHIKEISPSWEK